MLPKEVFLSHSSDDRAFATDLVEVMRRHGIPVWYSRTNIVGAQQWHDEIGAALKRCDWFVLILSPSSVQSTWVKRELLFALDHFENRIVPLLCERCDYGGLSWTLSSFQMVNFAAAFEQGCRDLLRVWGVGYQPQ